MSRHVLLLAHPRRQPARESAQRVLDMLSASGITTRMLDEEAGELDLKCAITVPTDEHAADGVELVLVLGGDGSLLRGAELARPARAPLLGVNLGHIGFLAEAEPDALDTTVERIVARDYEVEERMTVDVCVRMQGEVLGYGWAWNEASVEKAERGRMVECVLEVEGRPLSRWACDGVVCATPTGSTAYAFSGGGPIVWPTVQALLVVPISAHALFARPLVVAPDASIAIEVLPGQSAAIVSCDGRRSIPVPQGGRIEVTRGRESVRLARMQQQPFTDRLVRKFDLPVHGWRGRARFVGGES